jgi:NAD(P)-dependent dehydrogenase (short-subunit alcohol dehydrogenase family)
MLILAYLTRFNTGRVVGNIVTNLEDHIIQGFWEYSTSKAGLLGFMRVARRSTPHQGIRINYVAPHWVRSAIRSAEYEKYLLGKGVQFAEREDVARCMIRIACDRSINGMSSTRGILGSTALRVFV